MPDNFDIRVNKPITFPGDKKKIWELGEELLNRYKFVVDKYGIYEYDPNEKYWIKIEKEDMSARCLNIDHRDYTTDARLENAFKYALKSMRKQRYAWTWNNISKEEIPFKDYIYNILTGNRIDHNFKYFLNNKLKFNYNPMANCSLWEKCLTMWFGEEFDKIKSLQEFMGYSLMTNCPWKTAMYLYGPSGCGKSKVLDVVELMIGKEFCSAVKLEKMDDEESLAELKAKKVNIIHDVSSNAIIADGGWKMVICGEPITIKELYKNKETINATAKHWIAGNCFPEIKDYSDGVYSRLIILGFNNVIQGTGKDDKDLIEKLLKEMEGIIAWAMEGLKRLFLNGGKFTIPESSKKDIASLKMANNLTKQFIDESDLFEFGEDFFITTDDFLIGFNNYHCLEGSRKWTKNHLTKILKKDKRISDCNKTINNKTQRIYRGLHLKCHETQSKLETLKLNHNNSYKEANF